MQKFLLVLISLVGMVLGPQALHAQQQPTNYPGLQWDSGLEANKPGFCKAPGFYYATDTLKSFECDVTGHLTLRTSDGGGGTIPTTSSTLRGDNAGGASAVTGTGTNCVLVNGSSAACAGGGISGLTTNTLPKAASSTTIADSSVTDNGTTVATPEALTALSIATGTSPPTCTAGSGGCMAANEGTAPSVGPASGVDLIYADSTQHGYLANFNNLGYLPLVQGPASATSGHVATFSGTNGGKLVDGGALPTVTGGTCTNQVVTAISNAAVPTCASIVNAMITAGTIDLTSKVTGVLPAANGGALTAPTIQGTPQAGDYLASNGTNTSPACFIACVNISTTETAFTEVVSLAAALANNKGVRWTIGMDYASTGGPTSIFKVKACPTANYTPGGTCGVTAATLWTSVNVVTVTSNNLINSGFYIFMFTGCGSGCINTSVIGNQATKNPQSTSTQQVNATANVPTTATTIYLTITFASPANNNWWGVAQSVWEPLAF